MRILFSMDARDYDPNLPRVVRPSVRAVIVRNGLVAMEFVARDGFYKFPGGGMDTEETQLDTLIRETREEAGLVVRPETVHPYGEVLRIRLSTDRTHIFEQMNSYYFCEAEDALVPTERDAYEIEEGFSLVWANPKDAIEANRLADKHGIGWGMAEREARVLECLLADGVFDEAPED